MTRAEKSPVMEDIDIVRTFIDPVKSPVADHHFALNYWDDLRGDRFAPTWQDVSLLDFPGRLIPWISVTDIVQQPLDSIYRFWGTELTRIHGADFTGMSPRLVPPVALGMAKSSGCGRLVDKRAPHLEIKEFRNIQGLLGNALILRLPLSEDGTTVNHGLNIYYFEVKATTEPLHKFFNNIFASLGIPTVPATEMSVL